MSITKIGFGKKIKRLLKEKNMTRKQLADAIYVSHSTVSARTAFLNAKSLRPL